MANSFCYLIPSDIATEMEKRNSGFPEERVFLSGQGKSAWVEDLSAVVFHCPCLSEHFACVSPSLCTLLLLILFLLLFLFLSC